MIEQTKNLWDYLYDPDASIFITTNGFIKNNGCAVMGRGVAAQAKIKFKGIDTTLGQMLKINGNIVQCLYFHLSSAPIFAFPVKHNWWEKADLNLIQKSAESLQRMAEATPEQKFIVPRPGCGNGSRDWETEVRPIIEPLPNNVIVVYR